MAIFTRAGWLAPEVRVNDTRHERKIEIYILNARARPEVNTGRGRRAHDERKARGRAEGQTKGGGGKERTKRTKEGGRGMRAEHGARRKRGMGGGLLALPNWRTW